MSFLKLKVFMRMDILIQKKRTGTPNEFAEKVGVSRSSIFRYIQEMKVSFRAPIDYCDIRKSYRYREEFSLNDKDFFQSLNH